MISKECEFQHEFTMDYINELSEMRAATQKQKNKTQ